MSTPTTILVAIGTIDGAVQDKSGAVVPFSVADGEEVTAAKCAKLGIGEADLAAMIAAGKVVELPVRTAETAHGGDDAALAEMTARAETAEAALAELKKAAPQAKPAA